MLNEAQERLQKSLAEGTTCPCCQQFAKQYKRKINSSMARGLIAAYRAHGTDFGYLQDVRRKSKSDNREESKLRYWGLMEEDPAQRADGGRSGYWRVTDLGEQWILESVTVSKYAHIYNNDCTGHSGSEVTIKDALGTKFNYRELMSA